MITMRGSIIEKYILDRVEGNYAILENENGSMIEISIDNIDGNFREGDILIKEGDKFTVSELLTKERKDKINNMMNDMWE